MIIKDTTEVAYSGYGDEDEELFSVEDYAAWHYWCYYWSIMLDADSCTPHENGWKVVLSSPPARGEYVIGVPYNDVEMFVFWDDEHDCLNAKCLVDGNEGEIAKLFTEKAKEIRRRIG